jgi:hypothetical protein
LGESAPVTVRRRAHGRRAAALLWRISHGLRAFSGCRYGAAHHGVFLRTYVDTLCGDEEALRDRFWETCLNRLKAQLFSSWRFFNNSFNL